MPSRLRRVAAVLTVLMAASVLASAPAAGASRSAFVENPVVRGEGRRSALVHVRADYRVADGLAAARDAGLAIGTRYDVIKVFVAYGTPAQFERLAANDSIEALEANRRLELFTDTSHKATRGQDVLDGAVTMPDGTTIDGSGVGVAVIDSGVDGTHPDLENRMGGNVKIVCTTPQYVATGLTGFTECLGPKTAVPMDDTDHPSLGGHGTHVAGTVAGDGTASEGLYHGAAPGATLYGVSVGTLIAVENGLDGLAWVLENHDRVAPAIRVVNNSWGSDHREYDPENAPFHKATWKLQDALIAEGVTLVWAAGNAGGDGAESTVGGECVNPTPGLICVANYDDKNSGSRNGSLASTSSRGKSDDPSDWPDIAAPGTQIMATCRLTLPICNAHFSPDIEHPNLYAELSGTSMASPHVAGIVAQVLQANPTLSPADLENLLEDTAHKFQWGNLYVADPYNSDDSTSFEKGHGLVDVVAAITVALGGTPEPDPTSEPDPDPTATSSGPAEPQTYYFHSDTGNNHADRFTSIFVGDGASFNADAPTSSSDSLATETPFRAPNGVQIYDVSWGGEIGGTITDLTLDFWHRTPRNVVQTSTFGGSVWVGSKEYQLPTFTVPASAQPARATQVFTTTTAPDGEDEGTARDILPMNIPTVEGETVWVQLWAPFANDAGSMVLFDSVTHPSGFAVNSEAADPDPTDTGSPEAAPTTVSFTENSQGGTQYSDEAVVEAALTSEGEPVANAELIFEFAGSGGSRQWSATTDPNGVATSRQTFRDEPGSYQLTVRYAGMEDAYLPSADTAPFVVEKDDSKTALVVTGGARARGLEATVTDADSSEGLAGVSVEFFVGDRSLGAVTTDGSGVAAMSLPARYRNGPHEYEAVFGGDGHYLGSQDARQT